MPGVTKSMPSASSSSNPVSDALTNLTRAATGAFNAVQEQAQAAIAQAHAERDDALRVAQEARLDVKDVEMREEGWRAALEKSDMTIKHQAETIAQLRNEVDQWKTQLTRLGESSRQEIDDWKEQYRRAEHERTRLSARVDELMSGQMAWSAAAHAYTTPYAPRIAYTDIPEPSTSSTSSKRASTVSHTQRRGGTPHRGSRAYPDEPLPSTSRKPRATAGAHTDRDPVPRPRAGSPSRPPTGRRKEQLVAVELPRASGSKPAPRASLAQPSPAGRESRAFTEPRQHVIRRVTAIVDVKEEEPDDALEDAGSTHSGSVYEPDEDVAPIPPSGRRRRASHPTRRRQVVQDWDEDEQTPDVGDDADQYDEEPEDEDDELLLGPKKSKPPAGSAQQPRANGTGKGRGAGKTLKRKMDADTSTPSGRAGAAKAAKTR